MFAILLIITLLLYAVYALTTYKFDYWRKKKVPHEKPLPLLGNYKNYLLYKKYIGEATEELCHKFAKEPYFGTYYGTEPALVILDPEYLKLVLTKDFYYFSAREASKYVDKEVIFKNLFNLGGEKWKALRQNLTSLFSTAKMKNMFYLIENSARDFESMIDKEITNNNNNVAEAKFLLARYTMACVGSCVFGVETRTQEDLKSDNMFIRTADVTTETSYKFATKTFTRAIWPAIFYALNLKVIPEEISEHFQNLLSEIYRNRGYKPSARNDFVDLLLGFVNRKYLTADIQNPKTGECKRIEVEVDDEMLVAQSLVLFLAGFETSASTASFLLYELAKKPEALKRVQAEVDNFLARHDNRVTYECVTEMPFLESCIDETLRLYPVLGTLPREVSEDYTFPSGLRVEKELRVHIPVYYFHRNSENFPDPLEFRPERFSPENRKKIKPYTYMPFGEGPRLCLGMRFAKMQMYPGLITILKKYKVELADETPRKLKLKPKSVLPRSVNGINLKFTSREGWKSRVFAERN